MEDGAEGRLERPEGEEEAQLEELRKETEQLRQALQTEVQKGKEYLDMARRIQADFDNYKKRSLREKEEYNKAANDRLIAELLNILDDLDRALCSGPNDEELRRGVAQVHKNLLSFLKGYGLSEIPNDVFDPQKHEAFGVGEGEDGQILEVYQKGYCLGPRVLRHSKVKVGKKIDRGENNG